MSHLEAEQGLFNRYISTTLRATLDSLQPFLAHGPDVFPPPLSASIKARCLHTLTYAFKVVPANQTKVWPETRLLLLSLAPEMEKAGHRFDWLPYLQKGVELAEEVSDTNTEILLTNHIGYVYQLSGDYDDAYQYFEAAAETAEQTGDIDNLTRSLNCLAYIAKLQRKFDKARALVSQAKILTTDSADGEHAHAEFILGTIELEAGNNQSAIRHFVIALDARLAEGDYQRIARTYNGLATAYHAVEEYTQAISLTEKALELFDKCNDLAAVAIAEMNIGTAWLCEGKPDVALGYYKRAKPILERTIDKHHLSMLWNNVGYSNYLKEEWQEAIDSYGQGILLQIEINDTAGLLNTLEGLGKAYLQNGQTAKAYETFEEAIEMLSHEKDTLLIEKYHDMLLGHIDKIEAKAAKGA